MAGNDNFVPVSIDLDTLETTPELIQVRNAGNFTPEENAYWNGMAKLTNLNTFLTNDPDVNSARDSFFRLDPSIQQALIGLNPEAEYAKPKEGIFKRFLAPTASWFSNPLRTLEKAGNAYVTILENTALNAMNVASKVSEAAKAPFVGKDAIEKVTSSDFWTEGWNGYNKWNQEGIAKLDEQYGRAVGTLARGYLDKKNTLEIFREYGTIDNDMAEAFYKTSTPEFDAIVERYSRYKISLGNKYVDFAGRYAPLKEKPTTMDNIREAFLIAPLTIGGMRGVKRDENGEFVTEKILGKGYGNPGVGLDIAILFGIDPLTYVTFGGKSGIAAFKGARTAQELQGIANGAKKLARVEELFQDKQFVDKSNAFLADLNTYRDALNANDVMAAGRARLKISLDHSEYDDDILIGMLANSTVKKNGEEVPITDLDTWFRWFETGQNLNYLVNGKMSNIITMREETVALQTRQRKIINGIKSYGAKVFQGLDRGVVIGAKPLPGELAETWVDVEKAMLSRPVLTNANTPEEMLAEIQKTESTLQSLVKPKNNAKADILRAFGEQLARMPAERIQIFWDDSLVDKSMDSLRSYARLITGDRMRAEFIAQHYKMASKSDRVNILYNLDKMWLDSIGAAATPQGMKLRDSILQSRYINSERASIADFTTEVSDVFKVVEDVETLPPGPSALFHTTEGITMMPFDKVIKDVYDSLGGALGATKFKYGEKGKYRNLVKKMGYFWYTGSTNNARSRAINRGITFALLIPKLGTKAAIDEATVLANVTSPTLIFNMLYGKGNQLSKIHLAITGDNTMQGPIKEYFLNKIGRNPAKFKSAAERKQMAAMKEVEVEFIDPDTGKLVKQKEFITAEEYFGMPVEEVIVRDAVSTFGTKFSDQQKSWIIDYYLLAGDSATDALIGSAIGSTYGDSMALGTALAKELYGKSLVTQALDKAGRKTLSKPYLDELDNLTRAEKNLAHYKYFYLLFAKNTKYGVDLPDLFWKTNALRTDRDLTTFINYAMASWGWNPSKPNPAKAKKLNDLYGQVTTLRAAGKTEEEISKMIIVNSAKEMRYVFHGGTGFNEKLYKLIDDKIWAAKEKVGKSQDFADIRQAKREAAGVQEPISETEALRRQQYYRSAITFKSALDKLTDEEFYKAIEGFELKGKIKTDIDFPEIAAYDPDLPKGLDKIMTKGWDWMDRQVNDFIRSDVFRLKMLEEREKLVANEEIFYNHLVKEGMSPENARVQAAGVMANQAMHNAANTLLKYIDNPQLKSQLAFNMRIVGRFIRAAEDFSRRTLRWLMRHPESIPYRIGHTSHAASGSGILHTDDDGNKYVVIPNDGVFWQDVAPAIVMLANPLYATTALGAVAGDVVLNGTSIKDSPYWGFFKQAEWNQYTLKVSLLNPSYSEDAGVYTFVGPNMAIPVSLVRDFIVGPIGEALESSKVYNFGLSLDNILLGDIADNTNWARALLPPAVGNYIKSVGGWMGQENNQGAIAAYQAIAYMQYNEETAKRPEDFLNKEGVYDPSKAQEFLDEWRIQTANVLAQKAAFNTIFGAPLALGAPDIAKYLRDNGTVTLTKEYGDILRGVLQFNQENGFPIADPYTTAVSLHAAERPGKLIFQVPKGLNETNVAINYTQETLSWAIENNKFLEKFSTAGWIFAPNTGKYDPKIIGLMQALDLIPPNKDPFDWNNKALKQYIEKTTVAKLISKYYQYDRDVDALLNDPNNELRNFVDYREEVKAKAKAQQEALLNNNPLLKAVFGTRGFESTEGLRNNFNELRTIVTEDKFPKGVTYETRNLLKTMVRSASELLIVAESNVAGGQYFGDTELERQVGNMYDKYNKIASQNAVLGEAWTAIIQPLLDKVYDVPFRAVRKPGD